MFDLRKEQEGQSDVQAEAQAPNTRFCQLLPIPFSYKVEDTPQPDGLAPGHTAPPPAPAGLLPAPAGLLPAPAVLQPPYSG